METFFTLKSEKSIKLLFNDKIIRNLVIKLFLEALHKEIDKTIIWNVKYYWWLISIYVFFGGSIFFLNLIQRRKMNFLKNIQIQLEDSYHFKNCKKKSYRNLATWGTGSSVKKTSFMAFLRKNCQLPKP